MLPRLIQWFLGPRPAPVVRARPTLRKVPAQNDSAFLPFDLPPLDMHGLRSIERRAQDAHQRQLRSWIDEIVTQMPLMQPLDRGYAADLLLKLRYLLDSAVFERRA